VADHGAEQVDGAVDVDLVVVQGLLARLADSLEGMLVSVGCIGRDRMDAMAIALPLPFN
jgi:hypothetical protein